MEWNELFIIGLYQLLNYFFENNNSYEKLAYYWYILYIKSIDNRLYLIQNVTVMVIKETTMRTKEQTSAAA